MYSNDQLNSIAGLFGLVASNFQELTFGSRWMGRRYAVATASGRFFLKVRSEWWPVDQTDYVCTLVQYLHSQEFPVAFLHLTTKGEPFALWEGHICECHEFIDGQPLTSGNLDQNTAAGQTLSRLHSLTRTYSPPGSHLPEGCGYPWPGHVQFFSGRVRNLFADQEGAMAVLEQVLDALRALDSETVDWSRQDRAVVHGDYHPVNLILRDGQVSAVCDFDFVQQAPRAYDLAYFLYRTAGISSRGGGGVGRLDRKISQAFLDGYHSDGQNLSPPVPRDEIGRELLRFAWYDCLLEANNTQELPRFEEWISDTVALRDDVEQWVAEQTKP